LGSLKKKLISILFIIGVVIVIALLNVGPPKVVILSEGNKIPIVQGSYCWKKITGVECVDKILPIEIIEKKNIEPFPVSPQSEIKINFKKNPTEEIEVQIEEVEESGDIVDVERSIVKGNVLSAPKESGVYIYSVTGRWDKGSSSYSFIIKVK
jgi:hypothetical protein